MKITKSQLKQIVKEELQNVLVEGLTGVADWYHTPDGEYNIDVISTKPAMRAGRSSMPCCSHARAEKKTRLEERQKAQNVLDQKLILRWIGGFCAHVSASDVKGYILQVLSSQDYRGTLKEICDAIGEKAKRGGKWQDGWTTQLFNLAVAGNVENPNMAMCKQSTEAFRSLFSLAKLAGVNIPEVCPEYINLEWANSWAKVPAELQQRASMIPGAGQLLKPALDQIGNFREQIINGLDPWLTQAWAACPKPKQQ